MPKEICIEKEILEELYINQNLMVKEIAEKLGYKYDLIRDKLRKYGIKKPVELHVLNIKRSCLNKYGVENGGWTKESQQKIHDTNMKKYGVKWYKQDPKNQKKCEEKLINKYGVSNVFQLDAIKDKMKLTNKMKFGCEYNMQNALIRKKVIDAKRKHNTFNSSAEENKIMRLLQTRFQHVIRQYSSNVYPFACDFYISELDLYIEHQGYWSHGGHPYNPLDENDIKKLNGWKLKGTEIYNNAINVWTVRDPLKREIAKKNNLNWIEFFSIDEFNSWFEKLNKSN